MADARTLPFQANGIEFSLSFQKYSDPYLAPVVRSTEIARDRVILPSGQTVAAFKQSLPLPAPQSAAKRPRDELLDEASIRAFGKPYQEALQQQKVRLQQRYAHASEATDSEARLSELRACAREGHVQACLDAGLELEAAGNPESIELFVDAHHLGHPEALLCLWRVLYKGGDAATATRVLVLGAYCGSVRCGEALWLAVTRRPGIFETPDCLLALSDGLEYGSIHAGYVLGFVLRHSVTLRDDALAEAVMQKAAEVRHFSPGKGKGTPIVKGGKRAFAAGTPGHFEKLIDDELFAMRSKRFEPEILTRVRDVLAEHGGKSQEEFSAAFVASLQSVNQFTKRMAIRIGAWLEEGENEPVDPVKAACMDALEEGDIEAAREHLRAHLPSQLNAEPNGDDHE